MRHKIARLNVSAFKELVQQAHNTHGAVDKDVGDIADAAAKAGQVATQQTRGAQNLVGRALLRAQQLAADRLLAVVVASPLAAFQEKGLDCKGGRRRGGG